MKTIADLKLPATTGIGSLPHHNIDSALEFAFQTSIPFLPQIPIRNPWEYMIAQALEGLPGLEVDSDASTTVDLSVWTGRTHSLNQKLNLAFNSINNTFAFEPFEPTSSTMSCWQPYLWELQERKLQFAKIQIAGPLTCQWALRGKDGKEISAELLKLPELTSQIYRLLLARALAMSRRVTKMGVQPILYIDEPALFGWNKADPRHAMAFQELKLMIQALSKENVIVGLHCCSDTDWASVLSLHSEGLNILSLDVALSFDQLLKNQKELQTFLMAGSKLSLGIIPTIKRGGEQLSTDPKILLEDLLRKLSVLNGSSQTNTIKKILLESIYTPACGLALHTTTDAEEALHRLIEFQKLIIYNFS